MATNLIEHNSFPTGYGTAVTINSGYTCPSNGIIIASLFANDSGYCYVTIGNGPQNLLSKSNSYGLSSSYLAFKGDEVIIEKTKGSVKFYPFTYD